MAATNFTPISLYYSTTAATAPTAGNLVNGELAINITDGKLYYKDNAGVVQVIAGKGGAGVAGGSNTQVQYNSSGSLAGSANMTFSGTALTLANDASISGLTVGKGGGSKTNNTAFGLNALAANTLGEAIVAIGQDALAAHTNNNHSVAVGYQALKTDTLGYYNVAVGSSSLYSNTTGNSNTVIGYQAAYTNTTASNNTAVGYRAAYANTTGTDNNAFGRQSLAANTTGNSNNVFGSGALGSNTTGSNNCAFGESSLAFNTTASSNTAVGYQALFYYTTALYNTAVGRGAMTGNSGGSTGGYNAAFGFNCLANMTTGSDNTAIGWSAGSSVTTGVGNILLGYNANPAAAGSNYEMVCGVNAIGKGGNTGFFAMGAMYQGSNATTWATTSDQRIKKNIVQIKNGLEIINALNPVEFDYKETDKHEVGFIAQEYKQVLPDQITTHDPNNAEKAWVGDDKVLSIQQNLVPYLVKAIQELKAEVDSLKQQLGK